MAGRDQYFDRGDVVLSTAEKGQVRVNLGDVDRKIGYGVSTPVWGPDGYLARPNDPEGGACQALYLTDGQNRRVVAFCDHRFAAQAGTLEPGDRMIVSSGDARFFLRNADNRIGCYTEATNDPPVGGKGMLFDMNGKTGDIIIKRGGQMVVLSDDGNVSLVCAGQASQSSIVMTPTTITITAGTVNIAGGFVALGLNSDGTIPGKPGIDTVCIGALGQSSVASPKVYAAQY